MESTCLWPSSSPACPEPAACCSRPTSAAGACAPLPPSRWAWTGRSMRAVTRGLGLPSVGSAANSYGGGISDGFILALGGLGGQPLAANRTTAVRPRPGASRRASVRSAWTQRIPGFRNSRHLRRFRLQSVGHQPGLEQSRTRSAGRRRTGTSPGPPARSCRTSPALRN